MYPEWLVIYTALFSAFAACVTTNFVWMVQVVPKMERNFKAIAFILLQHNERIESLEDRK